MTIKRKFWQVLAGRTYLQHNLWGNNHGFELFQCQYSHSSHEFTSRINWRLSITGNRYLNFYFRALDGGSTGGVDLLGIYR